MATRRVATSLGTLRESLKLLNGSRDPLLRCLAPSLSRTIATEVSIISTGQAGISSDASISIPITGLMRRAPVTAPDVLATIYSFPSMEPLNFATYSANKLSVPLRRDILHRAVIFEGDATRQGTASSKWRDDVRGSGKKIRAQKGLGMARLGDKKSPMLRGGGAAFGPHPRDFSTKLPQKIYDLAWRTALSYRYKKGELIIIADGTELEMAEPRWLKQILKKHRMGHDDGRSLLVTTDHRPNLFTAMEGLGQTHGKVRMEKDVDVKNILEHGRIIIEKSALDKMFKFHSSHLDTSVPTAV